MTTSSSTSSFPSLLSSLSCKSKKPRKVSQKKIGGGSCPPGKCTVANVRILGVVNVRLANDLTTLVRVYLILNFQTYPHTFFCVFASHPFYSSEAFIIKPAHPSPTSHYYSYKVTRWRLVLFVTLPIDMWAGRNSSHSTWEQINNRGTGSRSKKNRTRLEKGAATANFHMNCYKGCL